MALIFNGTKNELPSSSLPTGYTAPTITEFSDYLYERTVVLNVNKAGVENFDRAITMANITDDASWGLDKLVTNILTKDFDTVLQTVTSFARFTNLSNNYVNLKGDGDVLSNQLSQYVCTVTIYTKVL